jgi:hypothetical protein
VVGTGDSWLDVEICLGAYLDVWLRRGSIALTFHKAMTRAAGVRVPGEEGGREAAVFRRFCSEMSARWFWARKLEPHVQTFFVKHICLPYVVVLGPGVSS